MTTKVFLTAFAAACVLAFGEFSADAVETADGGVTYRMSLSECRDKATNGDAEAMWQFAKRYEDGDGVKKDMLKAVSLYRKAADKRHPKACARMSELYKRGIVVKKDPALAAKYEAMSNGESGEAAATIVKLEKEEGKTDDIEIALDHILGRNGKPKDPKTGVRILYEAAKDKPAAQRVFVRRWAKGDLNEALLALDDFDLERVAPWFANEFANGLKAAGQILGIDCYNKAKRGCGMMDAQYLPKICFSTWENNMRGIGSGNADEAYYYNRAIHFWNESQLPKCIRWIAEFYDSSITDDLSRYSGPESMKEDRKAILAYERCVSLDSKDEFARMRLGFLYLLSKDEKNRNPNRSLEHFQRLLQMDSTSAEYNYYYGLARYTVAMDKFNHDKTRYVNIAGKVISPRGYNTLVESTNRELKKSLEYIRIAADKGNADAADFIKHGNTLNYRKHGDRW